MQALTGLSWLSYSQPGDLSPVPDFGQKSASPVARSKAPHASRVERAAPNKLGGRPGPLRTGFAPALHQHHPAVQNGKACPCRPRSGGIHLPERGRFRVPAFYHRIEHRDYSHGPNTGERAERHRSRPSARITPMSLRRSGRAPLDAPSSTSQHHGGWLNPPP